MAETIIYLDYAASTPIDPRVVAAMAPHHGAANPASTHAAGRAAADLVESARCELAALIGGSPNEIVFTSGATEADNLAIIGVLKANLGNHVVTAATEHKAVLETVLANCPTATVMPVDRNGIVEPADVLAAIRPETVLVTIMAVNNEVGTLQRLREIGEICQSKGVLFHTDAAQAVGRLAVDVSALGVDLLSISGHKMYGPRGVGALWIRRTAQERLRPLVHGGGHERGLRSGTVNVPGCVGLGEAARLMRAECVADDLRTRRLRQHLQTRLEELFPCAELNGHPHETVPGIVNVRLPGVDADSLLLSTPRVAASTGSACTSAVPAPSHVLLAMGVPYDAAQECIRLSFGRFTTTGEIDLSIEDLVASAALLLGSPVEANT